MNLWNRIKKKADLPAARVVDAESASIWAELKNSDLSICCKACLDLISRGGTIISIQFTRGNDIISQVDVKVHYCPGCGRKLR